MARLYAWFMLLSTTLAFPTESRHFSGAWNGTNSTGLTVDLGYEVYQGRYNATTNLNEFFGIRYAQDTSGANRWQPPKKPLSNRNQTISAFEYPQRCSQGPNSPGNYSNDYTGTEDCLFLSVFAPPNANNLPVYVWIHGGGYGQGQGNQDLSSIINTNKNSFIGVVIQYRLAAFGFLSSDEVARFGTPNAGILDQHFCLEWVQEHITKFGGDPRKVTISGESAGGGSVMLLALANGGDDGTKYFSQIMAQSPYLPFQYDYNAFEPSQSYYAFAAAAGCFNGAAYGNQSGTIFECLVSKSSDVLQSASAIVSGSGGFGTWAFLPVTDGKFIKSLPSQQITEGKLNGERFLSGNNANEGAPFVPPTITTEQDFVAYIHQIMPLLDNQTVSQILSYYPTAANGSSNSSDAEFATTGLGGVGATALDTSQFASGQQQRAYNLYAEVTFICPSYWLPEAYTSYQKGGYKYQFSPPPSLHGNDVGAFYGPRPEWIGADLFTAFQTIFGNFITTGDPSIDSSIANGAGSNVSTTNPASAWPTFSLENPLQINLNETGGVIAEDNFFMDRNTTYLAGPGRVNDISLVNAASWEGGRGARCEFWRSIGPKVPV